MFTGIIDYFSFLEQTNLSEQRILTSMHQLLPFQYASSVGTTQTCKCTHHGL